MGKATENWRRPGENFHGLKWAGRHKDGISKYRGTWRNGAPLWFCRIFTGLGLGLLTAGMITVTYALLTHNAIYAFGGVLLLVGVVFTTIGALCYKQHRFFAQLFETDELTEQMGLTSEEIARLAAESNIKPKVYFNDVPLYHPDELIQARSLLRASDQPVKDEILLRAASPTSSATETEQLLRASTNE